MAYHMTQSYTLQPINQPPQNYGPAPSYQPQPQGYPSAPYPNPTSQNFQQPQGYGQPQYAQNFQQPPPSQGYAQPNYPPPVQNYQPPPPNPVSNQAPPSTSAVMVLNNGNQQSSGSCPMCNKGIMIEEFSCCGILWAILCFPCGLICLFCMKSRRCASCGFTRSLC